MHCRFTGSPPSLCGWACCWFYEALVVVLYMDKPSYALNPGTLSHTRSQVVRRPGRDRPDVSAYLALFEHTIRDSNKLSPSETQAVAAFLPTAVPEFGVFATKDAVLKARELATRPARMATCMSCASTLCP